MNPKWIGMGSGGFTMRKFIICNPSRNTARVIKSRRLRFLNQIDKQIQTYSLCLEKLQYKSKRKNRTRTGIWTSDHQISSQVLYHLRLRYTGKNKVRITNSSLYGPDDLLAESWVWFPFCALLLPVGPC